MKNLRIYGDPPFDVVVLHGGPGAPGQMAPVARELSSKRGVLEPLQTKHSLTGQVEELHSIVRENGVYPVTLVGSSWGAMLGYLFSASHPEAVKKLILVGSGVYDKTSAEKIYKVRLNRLNEVERGEAQFLIEALAQSGVKGKNRFFGRLGELLTKADAFNPSTLDTEVIETQYDLHQSVWSDVVKSRNSGELLKLGKKIRCPVAAIHGDYDPHPWEGIEQPLSTVLSDFKFLLLKNCGHLPWIETEAKTEFYEILERELDG